MIHVSSENISDKLIADSEEYFKCKLINYYGQVEQALLKLIFRKVFLFQSFRTQIGIS